MSFLAGQDYAWTPADAGGHTAANDGAVSIGFENNSAGDVTATFASANESSFGPYPSRTFVIPAGTRRFTPAWDPRRFTSPATRFLGFTLSATANVNVCAVGRQTIFKDS